MVKNTGLWALTLLFGPSVAVDRLPDFLAAPNAPGGQPLPHHQCSIHLNCEDTLLLHQAFEDAMEGLPSHRWVGPGLCVPWDTLTRMGTWGGGACPDAARIASYFWCLTVRGSSDLPKSTPKF